MATGLIRRRVARICAWTFSILLVVAWAASLAIEAPWTPWFTICLWGAIGLGLLAQIVRGSSDRRSAVNAFDHVNEIYQGRSHAPDVSGAVVESVEVGHLPPRPQPISYREGRKNGEEESPRRSRP